MHITNGRHLYSARDYLCCSPNNSIASAGI